MNAPHPVDIHVGSRLRGRRNTVDISQTVLGDAVGLTFQQVQKYENGRNRISASRLYEFALGVEVGFFFEGMPKNALSRRVLSGRGRRSA